jgi:hypothetical protein
MAAFAKSWRGGLMIVHKGFLRGDDMLDQLPQSVRYVKNGQESKWWPAAKAGGQIHLGWWFIPRELLRKRDLPGIKTCIQGHYKNPGSASADFNAIKLVLENPSRHIWVTFEDGCLWWCTVRDGITVNLDEGKKETEGSFWLTCNRPWSNHSLGGRPLARSDLPGTVGAVAGFRATICEPKGSPDILRVIQDKKNPDAVAVTQTREAYIAAVGKLIAQLHDRDFELLIDLILARTGWTRLAKLGGVTEGIDIEAENAAANEIAFVQVKSRAGSASKAKSGAVQTRTIFPLVEHSIRIAAVIKRDRRLTVGESAKR